MSTPSNPPVKCLQCGDTHVILAQARDPDTALLRYRFTCLDCRIAWWQDEHGGELDDYGRRPL